LGDQYLLLLLKDTELASKLVGEAMGTCLYHDD
jgi:hypothetical protein